MHVYMLSRENGKLTLEDTSVHEKVRKDDEKVMINLKELARNMRSIYGVLVYRYVDNVLFSVYLEWYQIADDLLKENLGAITGLVVLGEDISLALTIEAYTNGIIRTVKKLKKSTRKQLTCFLEKFTSIKDQTFRKHLS